MFANISREDLEVQGYNIKPAKEFKTPDLSLKLPESKPFEESSLTQVIGQTLSKDRISLHKEEYKKIAEKRISEIDKEIAALPESKMDFTVSTVNIPFAGPSIAKIPVSDEKARLLKEKNDLRLATTDPTKLDYILGKAYNQSIIGLSDAIINGQKRAPEEWLSKYDTGTLTDVTATTLGFMLDLPFFGVAGKIGGAIGKAAAQPLVDRVMTKGVEKLVKVGFEKSLAEKLTLKGAAKISQGIASMAASGTALGSYGFVSDALGQWSKPDANFEDIKFGQSLKSGAKDFILGIGVGGLGLGSAAVAEKARTISQSALRGGAQVGIATGGLTAESALFTYGGALLEGRKLKDVTDKEFLETAAMLGMLKVSQAVQEPKQTAINIYKSLKFDPGKPGLGDYEVDVQPWEVESLNFADRESYESAMKILSNDDGKLADVLKDENIPALLKQKLLWGARGVAMKDVNLYADKIVPNEEFVDIYNKEGVLVDKRKFVSKEEANQSAIELGLQLEDNKMQLQSASKGIDRIKILTELKNKGVVIPELVTALDKPVAERTPEESKMVGDYSKLIPKEEVKPEEITSTEQLSLGEKAFTDKAELFKYLDAVAFDKEQGIVKKGWMPQEGTEIPNDATLKAITEWENSKKQPEKPLSTYREETPEEKGIRINDRLTGLVEDYNSIPKSYNQKRAAVMRQMQTLAQQGGYQIESKGTEVTITKEGKLIKRTRAKNDNQKLESIEDPAFKEFVTTILDAPANLYGLDIPMGPKGIDQAVKDLLAGRANQNTQFLINGLEDAHRSGVMTYKGEGQPDIPITTDELVKQIKDEKFKTFVENNGGFGLEQLDKAVEEGLISESELQDYKNHFENENRQRIKAEEEWAAEEADLGIGSTELPEGEEGGGIGKGTEEIKFTQTERNGVMFAKALPDIMNRAFASQKPFKDAFLKRKGITENEFNKLSQKEKDSLQEEWGKSNELQEALKAISNEKPNESIGIYAKKFGTYEEFENSLVFQGGKKGTSSRFFADNPDSSVMFAGNNVKGKGEGELRILRKIQIDPNQFIDNTKGEYLSDNKDFLAIIPITENESAFGIKEKLKEIYEKSINEPNPPIGKGEENIVPRGTEAGKEPVIPKGKEEPIAKYTPEQQVKVDAINKDYDTQIEAKQKELDEIPAQRQKALIKADARNGLFGDLNFDANGNLINPEEQGFAVNKETLEATAKPFNERIAELTKEIESLNKERESKIGEVVKQHELGFEETPKEIKATKEGITFKDKVYQSIDEVQEDFVNKKLTLDEHRDLLEQVRRYEDKKVGIEPLTDKPEELAWDEPLPLKAEEDPNFKNSDLNNAMSIRNIARSFIKNMGKIEGADVRTGFIKRFARKARGLFNPVSGIIRVKNIRDLRALTHEFGHMLDYEIFDIRGIISAKAADKQLGSGIDFDGEIYSNVAQVEKAMKDHVITIADGNYLLDKIKDFEKRKLKEKYSEIVEQGIPVGVKYKNKTYKSVKEINDALAKGEMPTTKASTLIVKFNDLNKGRSAKLDKLRLKYGDDIVSGVLQRNELKKEFDGLLLDVNYPSRKREEGIAEFVYNYVIDPSQLIRSTPNALAWFEKILDNAPEIKNALHQLREHFAKYDAQDIRTKMVAEIMPPEPEKTSWLNTIVRLGKDPMYNVVNMLRPVEMMVKKWKVMMDNNVLAYKDPWISAKQLLGQGGRSEQWILYHPYFNRGNDVIIREDIKGLMPILKPLLGTTDYLPYQTYLVALDAIESHNRGKPEQAYFDKETALAGKAAFEKQYGVQKLWDFQKDIKAYNEALLDFATEAGIISKETADYWKQEHQYYVPLRRIAETYEIMGGKKKTITRDLLPESEKVIFSRKGSQKQIRDIFESMIENTNHILASSERNLLNRNLADMFFDIHNYNKSHKTGGAVIEEIDAKGMEAYQDPTTGEIRYAISKIRPKNFRPPKGRILVVKEEGVPRFYDIAPEYYDDIFRVTNMVAKNVSGIMKVLSAPSHWLQAGAVVYDPTFPVRNIIRDQTSTWFTSKHGYLPTDFLKGIFSAIKKDNLYQKWLASGGDQSFLISADQAMSQNYFDKKLGKFARRKFDTYKRNPLLALQDFSKASEIGTRLGAFKNAYKKTGNVKLAAIESRDITADYGIHGAMTKQLFQLYPFLNARIQWARTMVESMKNHALFMLKGTALAIPAAINWLINNQDEESRKLYQSLPTWRRVGLFNVRIPGTDHFLPLPKGFYGVLFASSIESLLDAALKDDPRVLKELPQQLFQEISPISNWPEVIPFLARPQIEMWANKKGYTGKPIVSESMKLLKPSEQFYNSTPEIIKKMGEALNWSPVKIEHYFKSYTGGAGIGAVNILDEILQAIGWVDKKPEDTFTMLSRMPVLKALLTEKPIGLQSGYISDFYTALDKIEQVNITFNNYVKTENFDALDKFMSDPENKRMYSFYEGNSTALNSFRSALTFARDSMYAVMKDDLLTKKEKQEAIQKINDVIQESALKFKDAYEKREFFNYGKVMDDIVKKMKEEKKDYKNDLIQQQNTYNPYWMQLREQDKDVFDRLREFGGLKEIDQTRTIDEKGKKIDLELEDVRLFNETVIKRYGQNVKNQIGLDKATWEKEQGIPDQKNPEQTKLQVRLRFAWDRAMEQTKSDFKPNYSINK